MLALTEDLHTRLTAAGHHVLRPTERELALAGRVAGGPGGLSLYLTQHPNGFIQIDEPLPIGAGGPSEVFWCPFGAVAPIPELSEALARAALLTLCGIPGRDPGHWRLVIPATPVEIGTGAYLTRPTVTRPVIGGQI